ncbi:MAG TPA: hypothetical protein VLA49_07610 [Anaerolineales bacterium]|nr:hypothetical protein [Anaerolineales bacterium]
MRQLHGILCLSLVVGMVLLSACDLTGAQSEPTQAQAEAIYTSAAITLQAQLTANAATQGPADTPTSPPPTDTSPPPPPADTPTPTLTETPAWTPTSSVPMISSSVATNCRLGPSTLYSPPVGVLAVGDRAEVHGRNDAGTWWYISNPSRPGEFCWVWGETTGVEGSTASLPVITPPALPPTPTGTATPGVIFTAAYDSAHDCGSVRTAIFKITNSGGADLHSMNIKIEDLNTSAVLYGPHSSDAPFMATNSECPEGGDRLPAGRTYYVGGTLGPGNSGHTARATIKLCTANALAGTCIEKIVEFTIP